MTTTDFALKVLESAVEVNKAVGSPMLTGEKNLTIKKQDLIDRVRKNEHGEDYLAVMEDEAQILVRQGLFNGYIKDGEILFDIPDWDSFITAVNAFYVSYQDPDDEP